MLYLEPEYSGMKWPIHKLSFKKSCLDEYSELQIIYDEAVLICPPDDAQYDWEQIITPDQLMRYIIYTYHYFSPIAQKNADIMERKKRSLREAGVDLDKFEKDKEGKEIVAKIILSRHEFISHLSLHFLKGENNMLWMEACRLNELIYDSYLMLQSEDAGKKSAAENAKHRADAYSKGKVYRDDLNRISKELFMQDLNLQNFIASHILREKRIALITPERVALLIEENNGKTSKDWFSVNPDL